MCEEEQKRLLQTANKCAILRMNEEQPVSLNVTQPVPLHSLSNSRTTSVLLFSCLEGLAGDFGACYNTGEILRERSLKICMLEWDGKQYYKACEAAELAGVHIRTLRRWLANGNLAHFLFPYRKTLHSPIYYRLEPPDDTDQQWEGEAVYHFPASDTERTV